MKYRIILTILTTFAFNAFASLSLTPQESKYLEEKKQIKMCALPDLMPFEQIDENGIHKGISSDIIKIISKSINTPIILIPTKTWFQSLENIKNRKCDILPVAMDTKSRRLNMNFTSAYASEPFVITTKLNQIFINDSKDLENKKVGVVKGYAFIEILKEENPNIQIIEVQNAEEGLQKIREGTLFAYIDILPAVAYNIQKQGLVDLKIAGKLEFEAKISIASRNDEPLLNSIMQKSIDDISKEQLRTIVKRWLEIKVDQVIDYSQVLYIIIFFLIVLFLVLYKNRSISIMNKKLTEANKKIFQQQNMVNKYVLILNTDLKGTITDANEAYCKVLGFDRDELIDRTHKIMKHPSTSSKLVNDIWNSIKNDKSWVGQINNYTKDRSTKYFNVYIEPLFLNGKKVGYHSISEDITDKYLAEELNKYQKSLLSLFDKGDAVLFKWKNDKSKKVKYVSESIYRLTGYSNDEFTSGKINYSSLIHEEYSNNILESFKKAKSKKLTYFKLEPYRIITKEGVEKWVLENIVTINDNDGNIANFISYITDITEHTVQQKLFFQQSRSSALGEMIGNIAHQWRQPLSVISTASTGLKLSLELDDDFDKEEMSNTLGKINDHTQHLSKTIDDFRSFFKDDLNVVKDLNLKDTIRKVRELTIDSFNSNFIEYIEEVEDIYHEYNENILIQALLNIYNNAKDVLVTRKQDRIFFVCIKKENDNIILSFKDNGGGIKEDVLLKIFDPYFTTKHESVGTGIGLYMTNKIITKELHGVISAQNIDVKYKDETYKGVQFNIKIPII